MKYYKTEGIVLKRKNLDEADRMLTVFTKHYGKIFVRAKGIRKITSRRSSHVELLNHVRLTLYKGRQVFTLIEAENINDYADIKNDLAKIGYSYHICELVDGLCAENQEQDMLYVLLTKTLSAIETEQSEDVVHTFEKELLSQLGYYNAAFSSPTFNATAYIEQILERKLKTKQILRRLL